MDDYSNCDYLKEKGTLDPFTYYRQLRPYYFSDSSTTCSLTKELFEFQLAKLSADMKQDEFENFTRRLACRLITPNLIPQTGPTGGGDGKTDIETHPVSDDIAVHWYVPGGGCRGENKWAFAISCKDKWKEKVKHDVQNIVGTNRGFTGIHFFTNQLVKSKEKADLYDEFKKKYNIEVYIYDRNWFVQSVFDNQCEEIAVDSLNLSQSLKPVRVEGPNDSKRKKRIQEIEEKIALEGNAEGLDSEYVNDLLESAILSRYIEEAPCTIRGKFKRALSEAELHGSKQQLFEIIYQEGWTAFYWFRSPDEMYEKYQQLKEMLSDEVNVPRIERLFNLYNLISWAACQQLFNRPIDLSAERKYYYDLHKKLSTDPSTHWSALYLHICILELEMLYDRLEKDGLSSRLNDYLISIKEAGSCMDIHLSSHAEVFSMLGNIFTDNTSYDDVLDEITAIIAQRESELTAANLQYDRGIQNFEAQNYVDAIRHLGQCAILFQKEESLGELVKTNGFLASSCSQLDLINCERNYYVKASALMLHKISTVGTVDHLLITTLIQLCYVEIKSGQVTSLLNWLGIVDMLVKSCRDFLNDDFMRDRTEIDGALSAKLLCTDVTNDSYRFLPDVLGRAGLDISRDVLLFMLGHTDLISENSKQFLLEMPDWKDKLISQVPQELFQFPLHLCQDKGCMRAVVNGCEMIITYPANSTAKIATETILAFVESTLSTNSDHGLLMTTPMINIDLHLDNAAESRVIPGTYSSEYEIFLNEKDMSYEGLWKILSSFFALFLSRNALSNNLKEYLEKKQAKEKFIGRLSLIAGYKSDVDNLIGKECKPSIYDWTFEKDMQYPYKRDINICNSYPKFIGIQNNVEIESLIDVTLWDKAKWQGVGYIFEPKSNIIYLCLCFEDINAGVKIFEKWSTLYKNNKFPLRVSFIKGINKEHSAWYRVLITSEMKSKFKNITEPRYVQVMARMHTMTPNSSLNLDTFCSYFNSGIPVILCATGIKNREMVFSDSMLDAGIPFKNFVFKEAWEIGDCETETTGILLSDNPIIPEQHLKDAPVLKALSRKPNRKIPFSEIQNA